MEDEHLSRLAGGYRASQLYRAFSGGESWGQWGQTGDRTSDNRNSVLLKKGKISLFNF